MPDVRPQRGRLLVCSTTSSWGGAEIALMSLLTALEPEWEILVLGNDRLVVDRLTGYVGGHGLVGEVIPPVRSKRDVRGWWAHLRAFRRLRPDVLLVNLHDPWDSGSVVFAALCQRRARVVVLEHFPMASASRAQRLLKRLTCRGLHAHLSVSDAAARDLEGFVGVAPGSVQTLPNIVRRADSTGRPVALPPGLQRPVVVAAGRLEASKGFDVLLEAVRQGSGYSLWLLGDGAQRPALEAFVRDQDLGARVVIDSWHDQLLDVLETADVVVVPSRYESFGLVAHEAVLSGTPVVASRLPVLRDLLGDAAVYVEVGDTAALAVALQRVVEDPVLRSELVASGRTRMQELPTPDEVAARFAALAGR